MKEEKSTSTFTAALICTLLSSTAASPQSVSVETRATAESQTSVRTRDGGQGVNVETKSGAQSGTRTQVRDGAGAGVRVESGAAAASQTRVRTDGGAGTHIESGNASAAQSNVRLQGSGQGVNMDARSNAQSNTRTRVRDGGGNVSVESGAIAGSQTRVKTNGGAGTVIDSRSGAGAYSNVRVTAPPPQEGYPIYSAPTQQPVSPPVYAPPPLQPVTVESNASAAVGVTVPGPRRSVSCEKTEEIRIDDMNIKVINKSCRGKVMSLQAWRENGKTKIQFIFDNKGQPTATLKMSEMWFDRRGHAVDERIDEQRLAIEAGHNKAVNLTGPIPQAMTAVINLYR